MKQLSRRFRRPKLPLGVQGRYSARPSSPRASAPRNPAFGLPTSCGWLT